MILCIGEVLSGQELAELDALLAEGEFRDGRETGGWHAKLVKNNEQMTGPAAEKARRIIIAALERNPVFNAAVLPRSIRPPLIARYHPGCRYGAHVDDAMMGRGRDRARTDVSVTVFLSDPDSYGGGELVMDGPAGAQSFKLPRGAAITYPSNTLHSVSEVTTGQRVAAVTWVQSLVRDPGRREVLFDLDRARRAVFEKEGKSPIFDLLSKSHANLLRMWAE